MALAERVETQPERPASLAARVVDWIRRRSGVKLSLVLGPGAFWLLVFFLIPLGVVLAYSFASRGAYGQVIWRLTLENYTRFFDWLYIRVFLVSV